MYDRRNPKDAAKIDGDRPLISVGGKLHVREDVEPPPGCRPATGKPTVVGYTRNDLSMWSDMVARTIRAAGGRAGMMAHNAYGYGLFTGGLGYHYGAERLGFPKEQARRFAAATVEGSAALARDDGASLATLKQAVHTAKARAVIGAR